METQHVCVELADDDILVIARVANQSTSRVPRSGRIPRNAFCVRIVGIAGKRRSNQKVLAIATVEVWLVVGAATVQIVEVKSWRSEIYESVRIVLLLQAAGRI